MLADTLREARRKKGWSVCTISKRSGVSWGVIQQIESGSPSYVPSEGNTALLAEALRMPVGSLLSRKGGACRAVAALNVRWWRRNLKE